MRKLAENRCDPLLAHGRNVVVGDGLLLCVEILFVGDVEVVKVGLFCGQFVDHGVLIGCFLLRSDFISFFVLFNNWFYKQIFLTHLDSAFFFVQRFSFSLSFLLDHFLVKDFF